jgi:hypothetical protein
MRNVKTGNIDDIWIKGLNKWNTTEMKIYINNKKCTGCEK